MKEEKGVVLSYRLGPDQRLIIPWVFLLGASLLPINEHAHHDRAKRLLKPSEVSHICNKGRSVFMESYCFFLVSEFNNTFLGGKRVLEPVLSMVLHDLVRVFHCI